MMEADYADGKGHFGTSSPPSSVRDSSDASAFLRDATASPIEETTDRLYSLGPEEFTNARNEAAKRLRSGGDRAGSDLVRALRRPTVVAWAVNQLPRRRPDLVEELLEAGAALRAAQRAALSGSKRVDLRAVTKRRREAVAELLAEADQVLDQAGREPAPHIDAIRTTLEAASADEATGDLLRSGRLTKEVEPPSGLGDVSPFEVLPGGQAPRAKDAAGAGMDQTPAARRAHERMQVRLAKAEEALGGAQEAETQAREEAQATSKEVDRLERELRTARRRADRASKALSAAGSRTQGAQRALTRAQADLETDP